MRSKSGIGLLLASSLLVWNHFYPPTRCVHETMDSSAMLQEELDQEVTSRTSEKGETAFEPKIGMEPKIEIEPKIGVETKFQLMVVGIAQDAGYPQAGCRKSCCAAAWDDPSLHKKVSCLVVADQSTGEKWFFDCTPDFPAQLRMANQKFPTPDADPKTSSLPSGIFLSHAHIGHYTGLIHLGREVIGSNSVPVYAMPRMKSFLERNGPWSQLVKLKNIELKSLSNDASIVLKDNLVVTPFLVPHRDEFSETIGFQIQGPNKKALFIPDIDKWSKWDRSIEKMIEPVDFAFLDGTFLENGEIPGRDMSLIPHPFVMESISRFSALDLKERSKVRFIHLNHTNPALDPNSSGAKMIEKAGMRVAVEGTVISL